MYGMNPQLQLVEQNNRYQMNQIRMVQKFTENTPMLTHKMEAVREVLERQSKSTINVQEELKGFREEMRNEFTRLKQAWMNEMLTDLKYSLSHDLQDCVRVSTMDAVTSSVTHGKAIAEFGASEIMKYIETSFTSIEGRIIAIETKLGLIQQSKTFESLADESLISDESILPEESVVTEDSIVTENSIIPRGNIISRDGIIPEQSVNSELDDEVRDSKRRKKNLIPSLAPKKEPCEVPEEHRYISRNTNKAIDAYHEWYTSRDGFMSFRKRDEKYGVEWRRENPTVGLYKRRRHLDRFIEEQTRSNTQFQNFTKEEFAKFLDLYRQKEKVKLPTLCEKLGNTAERTLIARKLGALLDAQENS